MMNRRAFIETIGATLLGAMAPAILLPPEKRIWAVPRNAPVGGQWDEIAALANGKPLRGRQLDEMALDEASFALRPSQEPRVHVLVRFEGPDRGWVRLGEPFDTSEYLFAEANPNRLANPGWLASDSRLTYDALERAERTREELFGPMRSW